MTFEAILSIPFPTDRRLLRGLGAALLLLALAVPAMGQCRAPGRDGLLSNSGQITNDCTFPATPASNGWANVGTVNYWRSANPNPARHDWPAITNGTYPRADAGPCADGFEYVETTGGCGANAILEGPSWDASSVTQPTVSFGYHLQGADAGTLSVEAWDGAAWVVVWSISGDQGAGWRLGQAAVPTYSGVCTVEARFRFVYVMSSQGELGDCAIDELAFGEPQDTLVSNFAPEYQENTAALAVTIDGKTAQNDSCLGLDFQAAQALIDLAGPGDLEISSDQGGRVYDLLISASDPKSLSEGALALPDGQILNLDIAGGGFATLSGAPLGQSTLSTPAAGPNGSTLNIAIPSGGAPGAVSIQGYAIDAAALLGVSLSQATRLTVIDGFDVTGDDGMTPSSFDLTAPPFSIAGGFDFYGVNHTTIYITGNGRVSFTDDDTSTAPFVSSFSSDVPSIAGFWTDLNQRAGGSIVASSPAPGLIRFEWTDVPFFGSQLAFTRNSFVIELDANTGIIRIDGLQGLDAGQTGTGSADDQLIGISPGDLAPGGAASDPGPAAFAVNAMGSGGATDMLYLFNDIAASGSPLPLPVVAGLDSLVFTPDSATGGYTWIGL